MTAARSPSSDASVTAAARLWVLTRKHALWVVICALGVTALAVTVAPTGQAGVTYEARAVVIAQQLAIRPEALPKLAASVFETGSVAEGAVGLAGNPYAAEEVRDHVRLDPAENSVVMAVVGVDRQPEVAASVADAMSISFVEQLNKAGTGVGTFIVQDTARVPSEPVGTANPVIIVLVGALAGTMLGVGLVSLVTAVRQPVLTGADAAGAADAPLLANLALRRQIGPHLERPPPGMAAVGRALFPHSRGYGLIATTPGSEAAGAVVSVLTTAVLSSQGTVVLVPASRVPEELGQLQRPLEVTNEMPDAAMAATLPVVVERPSEFDLMELTGGGHVVLVVTEGTPAATVRTTADRFLPGELTGVVFVRWTFRSPRRRSTDVVTRVAPASVTEPELARRVSDLRREAVVLEEQKREAGTQLRRLVREMHELRQRAIQQIEAEVDEHRADLVRRASEVVAHAESALRELPSPDAEH